MAVHGLGSHHSSLWTYESKGKRVMWLHDLLPDNLFDVRTYLFDYALKLEGIQSIDIEDIAFQLLKFLEVQRDPNQVGYRQCKPRWPLTHI